MIDHLMLRLGRILSEDNTLRVQVRGSEAYSQPGEIVLPAIENFADLGIDDAERVLHGLVDHEVGHAVDTDHAVLGALPSDSLLRWVANAVEDGIIERRRGIAYPGSRYNLAVKNQYFWDSSARQRFLQRGPGSPSSTWKLVVGLTLLVRVDGVPDREVVASLLGLELAARLADAMDEVGDLDAVAATPGSPTEESVRRARRVLERLGFGPDDVMGPEAPPATPEAAVAAAFRARLAADDDGSPYTVFDPSFDLEADLRKATTPQQYANLLELAEPTVAQLVSVFEAAFYAHAEVRVLPCADVEDDRAEVDPTALSAYALGAIDVADIWEARTGDASSLSRPAVAVLVDCSGSMDGPKAHTAKLCAVACHEALERVHVPHEVSGFTTALSDHRPHAWFSGELLNAHFSRLRARLLEAAARGERLSRYARTCRSDDPSYAPLQVAAHAVCKAFDAPDASGIAAIAGIGNNLDGEALLWQARRLAQRPESRKVLIVLSDGLPNGSNRRAQGERHLSESIRRVTSTGIEVYAIGIQSPHVRDYYPHWRVCQALSDLPGAVASVLRDSILGGLP